jgi:hypothetical protein
MYRLLPTLPRTVCRPLLGAVLAATAAIAGGCANPREMLLTGSVGRPLTVAPWKTQASPASEAVRPLSDGEGELVIATAIAVHEMRRP